MLSEELITVYSQHTVYLQRVGASLGKDSIPYLEAIDKFFLETFNKYSHRNLTPKLELRIKEQLHAFSREQLQAYIAELKVGHREVGYNEGQFAASTANGIVESDEFKSKSPTAAQVNAIALASPIQVGEKAFTSYTALMRNYWQKWGEEIDGIVSAGFVGGGTIQEVADNIYQQLRLTTTDTSKNTLTRARRSARQLAITGTNHYANQARVAYVDVNDDLLEGYRLIAVIDSRTSQKCRALDQKVIPKDSPRLSAFTPPLHPNCRTAILYEVDDKYSLNDEDTQRASAFDINGKRDPKPVSSEGIYYDKMKQLKASDQDLILGPTLGKAFRKMNNPEEFAKATIDSLGNPLTIAEMKNRQNKLGEILRNQKGG